MTEDLFVTECEAYDQNWEQLARDEQKPPKGDWTTWLILGGRGAGKTRAGAEWIKGLVESGQASRIALVGESYENVREVMVEGVSGLLAIASEQNQPVWLASRHLLSWPSGAVAHCFSAEDAEGLRGFQFDAAWSDELATWREGEATWSNLQLGLRLSGPQGNRPRQVITTTPRPTRLLKSIKAQEITVMTHMTTYENRKNLAGAFMSQIIAQYEGTRIGRQELLGEILEEMEGGLWTRSMIEGARCTKAPALARIVVAIDPPASSGPSADECGIIVAGMAGENETVKAYVLSDESKGGLTPMQWAKRAIAAYHAYKADRIIVEANQGGEMTEVVLWQADPTVPVTRVNATRNKLARAEPVFALYEKNRVHHVGAFPELEDQMVSFSGNGKSPDRLDALVWALSELMIAKPKREPVIWFP